MKKEGEKRTDLLNGYDLLRFIMHCLIDSAKAAA